MRLGAALANSLASALASKFNQGYIDVYAGVPPADPDQPISATPIVSIRLPMVAFQDPVNGVLRMAGQWFGTVTSPGTPAYWVLRDMGNTLHILGTFGSGGDISLNAVSLVAGNVVQFTSFALTV